MGGPAGCIEFQWDQGSEGKSRVEHGVSDASRNRSSSTGRCSSLLKIFLAERVEQELRFGR